MYMYHTHVDVHVLFNLLLAKTFQLHLTTVHFAAAQAPWVKATSQMLKSIQIHFSLRKFSHTMHTKGIICLFFIMEEFSTT